MSLFGSIGGFLADTFLDTEIPFLGTILSSVVDDVFEDAPQQTYPIPTASVVGPVQFNDLTHWRWEGDEIVPYDYQSTAETDMSIYDTATTPTFAPGETGGMPDVVLAGSGGGLGGILGTVGKYLGLGVPAGGAIGGAVMRGARSVLQTAKGVFASGSVWALISRLGPYAAAAALGIAVSDLIAWMMANPKKKKRARGISARDVRTTRRTCRKISSVQHALQACLPAARFGYRRHHHHHRT